MSFTLPTQSNAGGRLVVPPPVMRARADIVARTIDLSELEGIFIRYTDEDAYEANAGYALSTKCCASGTCEIRPLCPYSPFPWC